MPKDSATFPMIPASEVQVDAAAPILKALAVINNSTAHIALVIDQDNKIIGSLVDGDIRRALLMGCTLESPVSSAMYAAPFSMPIGSTRNQILEGMKAAFVKQMPLVEKDGTLVGITVFDKLTGFVPEQHSNSVVIMVGGKGRRLLPHTLDIPKPMVEIGGKPMLEHILQHFIRQGFKEFHFCVNHLSHMIENYFRDGERWKCNIHYVREEQPLGTAGALSLIDSEFSAPFIVINGDILTSINFGDLIDYHLQNNSMATVCARSHRMEVPYGVLQIRDGMMQAIIEKPVYEDLISAGIYVLNPQALGYMKRGEIMDMPVLLQAIVKDKKRVAVFPMHEQWTDVGRPDDLNEAKRTYSPI